MNKESPPGGARVCVVGPGDLGPDSGSTIYSRMLANSLAAAGCDVTVLCARSHESITVPTIIAPIPMRHPFDHFQGTPDSVFADAISATIDAIETRWHPCEGDIIHAIYAGYGAIAAGVVAALSGTRTVVTELGRIVNIAAAGEERYRRMAALALARADHVIAATADIANSMERRFDVPLTRQTVLAVPMNIAGFRVAHSARLPDPVRCLSITTICSVLTEDKGVTDIVEGFALARSRTPARMRLNIVGQDPKAGEPMRHDLERLIKERGIAEHVTLTGYTPHDRIAELLAATDIYVDARRVANFSSVIPEAMAMNTPILAAAVASNRALLHDGIDAVLFEPGNPNNLAEELVRLAGHPELRRHLSSRGTPWIADHAELFSYEEHGARIARIYRDLQHNSHN